VFEEEEMVAVTATTMRLTRRGRLVVVLTVLLGLLVTGFSLSQAPSSAASHVVKPRTVTVQNGETLWALAVRIAPHDDPRLVTAEIERLNHLRGPAVFGGQQLVIPGR
jgi:LysM repeat protein